MKNLFFIVLIFLLPICVFAQPTYEELCANTVFITGITTDGQWAGTGVVIAEKDGFTYILTNRHVVTGQGEYVEKYNVPFLIVDNGSLCDIVGISPEYDLGCIKFRGKIKGKKPIKKINILTAHPSDAVYSVGHALGNPYTYTQGYVSGQAKDSLYLQLPSVGGQSGSGIFNDSGELIGLLWGGFLSVEPVLTNDMVPFPLLNFTSEDPHTCAVRGIDISIFLYNYGFDL